MARLGATVGDANPLHGLVVISVSLPWEQGLVTVGWGKEAAASCAVVRVWLSFTRVDATIFVANDIPR